MELVLIIVAVLLGVWLLTGWGGPNSRYVSAPLGLIAVLLLILVLAGVFD